MNIRHPTGIVLAFLNYMTEVALQLPQYIDQVQ